MRDIKVMIVDDEPPIADMVEIMVNRIPGYSVVAKAYNGKEAMQVYKEHFPDILICDIKMPCKSGLELVEELNEETGSVEAIIMSGYSDFEYARMAIKLDVAEYLLKPVNENDLRMALAKISYRILEAERVKSLVFGSEEYKNAESESELKREMFYLVSQIDKMNFKQIQQTCKTIFLKLEKEAVTTHTLTDVLEYLGTLFDLRIHELIANCSNYAELYDRTMLAIKKSFPGQVTLTAGEVVDLLEDWIRNNYTSNISGKQIFEQYGYNEVYLTNLFKQQKGMTPKQLLQKIRIEKAIEIISETPGIMIKTVSEMLGYPDQLGFSKIFKEYTGVSPKEFISRLKEQ